MINEIFNSVYIGNSYPNLLSILFRGKREKVLIKILNFILEIERELIYYNNCVSTQEQ